MEKGQLGEWLDPDFLCTNCANTTRLSAVGFEATWHKAVHLVTTTKQ